MHTLHITSRPVSVALQNNSRTQQAKADGPHRSGGLVDACFWVNAAEHLVGSYLDRGYPETLTGQHRDLVEAHRLGEAFSGWDVAAHRALAAAPTTRTLALIVGQQMLSAHIGHRLWHVAVFTGHIETSQLRTRLSPALERVGECWDRAYRAWNCLTPRSDPSEPADLRRAAGELLAAQRELTHDRVGAASPPVIAARTDMAGLVSTLEQALASSVDLTYTHRDAAAGATLMVAARPASLWINYLIERASPLNSQPPASPPPQWPPTEASRSPLRSASR